MPRTFCNDALTTGGRHRVKVRRGEYIMSGSWIDTTAPSDMMDYDCTKPICDLKARHDEFRLLHISLQSR